MTAVNPILFPVTYDCNLDCVYCSEKYKKGIVIDIDKSLKATLDSDNDWVYITGGEPLLVPDIADVCRKLKLAGKKVGLTTNGTIHNFEVLKHLDRIGVSIDGDQERTDLNRGKGTFQKAVEFLKEAVRHNIETVIMATMDKLIPEQENFLEELGNKLGVTYLQVTLC